MIVVGFLAAAANEAKDPGAARLGSRVRFEHQGSGALGHDEAVAVF